MSEIVLVKSNKYNYKYYIFDVKVLVVITVEVHLFPFRIQKLSQLVPMVVHFINV